MAAFVPRWYQSAAVASIYDYFEHSNGNPLIAMPTGTGKSAVSAGFIYTVMAQFPNQRILLATHVKELILNNFRALMNVWPNAPAGIYSSGLKQRDLFAPITFGGIASIIKVIEAFGKIDLFIIDECHLLGPSADGMYMRVILALKERNPKLKVIGLTATPWSTGLGLLTNGEIFTDICYDLCTMASYQRLFVEGYLVKPVPKRVDNEFDVSGVTISNGDYSKSGLNEVTRNEKVTWAALNESLNKNPDRYCRLVFCTGIEHALLAAEMLSHLGLRAQAVHSKMSDGERDGIFKAYFAGELDALTNNGIATTGIDHPPIDHIIMLRPTMSVGLWVQMVGRGMRPFNSNGFNKENCIISDHGGNARRLGPIDDPYIPKMKGKGSGDAPVKICPACDAYNHASARVCDHCGEPFVIKIGYTPKASDDIIIRSDLPIYETYQVDHVYYTQHLRRDATPETKPTIKATYQCGMLRYQEFIAIEALGYLAKKARDWWRQRFP